MSSVGDWVTCRDHTHILVGRVATDTYKERRAFVCFGETCKGVSVPVSALKPATVAERTARAYSGKRIGGHRFDGACDGEGTPECKLCRLRLRSAYYEES